MEGEDRTVINRAGWKRIDGDKVVYMFTSGGLAEAAGRGIKQVTKALAGIDAFAVNDSGSYSKNTRTKDGVARLYHLDTEAIKKVSDE